MAAQAKHKDAIVEMAAALFRRHGYAATGLSDIVEASGAPKGSLYHYFPEGKQAIGVAAVAFAGARVTKTLRHLATEHRHADGILNAYAALLAGWMAKSGFRDGCPITTTLLETAPESEAISHAGEDAFAEWRGIFSQALQHDGIAKARAESLARFAIAAMEGSLILARVERSPRPIVDAAREVAALFIAARRNTR